MQAQCQHAMCRIGHVVHTHGGSDDCSDGGWQWRSLWQWQRQFLLVTYGNGSGNRYGNGSGSGSSLRVSASSVQRPPPSRAFLPPYMAMPTGTTLEWTHDLLGLEVSRVGDRGFPEGPANIGHADDADDDEDGG